MDTGHVQSRKLSSPVVALLQLFVLYHFDPVVIWVKNECDVFHPSIGQSLLPVDLLFFKKGTSLVQIVDTDADMSKSLRLVVAVVVDFAFLLFRAIVPGQLEEAFLSCQWVHSVRGVGRFGNAIITWIA